MRGISAGSSLASILAALGAFMLNVAIVAVPTLAAQSFTGKGTTSTLDALFVAFNLVALGHHGALLVHAPGIEGSISLVPLGLTLVFFVVCAVLMRRLGHDLNVVDDRGALKHGAFGVLLSSLAVFSVTYAALVLILSLLSVNSIVHPNSFSAALHALLLAALGAIVGLMASLVRSSKDSLPAVSSLALVPEPYASALRAIGASLLSMLAFSAVVLAIWMAFRHGQIAALYSSLNAGAIGNSILTLGQLAVVPSGIVWMLAVLLGGTTQVGVGTSISLAHSTPGVLPALPVFGAIPDPGTFPAWVHALIILPIAGSIIGALVLARSSRHMHRKAALIAWGVYVVGAWLAVLILVQSSAGSFGAGHLLHVGPRVSSMWLSTALIIAIPAAIMAVWTMFGMGAKAQAFIEGQRSKRAKASESETAGSVVVGSSRTRAKAENADAAPSAPETNESAESTSPENGAEHADSVNDIEAETLEPEEEPTA